MSLWGKAWRVGLYSFILVLALILWGNWWVVSSTKDSIFSDCKDVPANPVGLVLGTSSRSSDGSPNRFFDERMNAAAELYHLGKVTHIIVSGDNRTKFYNEPLEMKMALIKLGVPDSAITLDYAGLRTLDSVVRSKEIFGQNNITIITQPFHSYRAVFISNYFNIHAVALVSGDSDNGPTTKIYIREYLARAKAILDLYVLKTTPRYLGEKEPIAI